MIEGRVFVILIPVIFFWFLMFPQHRKSNIKDKLRINRIIAFCAGSRNEMVNARAFSFQIGYLGILLSYFLFVFSGNSYIQENAAFFCVVTGMLCGILSYRLFSLFSSKD